MNTQAIPEPGTVRAAFAPIRKSIVVNAPPELAFRRFTAEMGTWWPLPSHSVGQRDAETVTMEAWVGGRIVEKIRGGRESVWGSITAWDPPHRVAFTWHPGHTEAEAMDVEVRFAAEGERTRVELEHRGFEKLPTALAKKAHRGYPMGWDYVLGIYADRRGLYQALLKGLTATLMLVMRLGGKR